MRGGSPCGADTSSPLVPSSSSSVSVLPLREKLEPSTVSELPAEERKRTDSGPEAGFEACWRYGQGQRSGSVVRVKVRVRVRVGAHS